MCSGEQMSTGRVSELLDGLFYVVFCVSGAGGPREDSLCGLRYSYVHHREVGVSRSDLRSAQGQTARTWPPRFNFKVHRGNDSQLRRRVPRASSLPLQRPRRR